MKNYIPKNKHALIRICKLILKIDNDVTEDDIVELKKKIQQHLDSGMSPNDIKNYYELAYTDFGMFIKKCLGLKLLTCKEANINYCKKNGKINSDAKACYKLLCDFQFSPHLYVNLPGYQKLLDLGFYHPLKNPNGVCRDHMVSKEYGWRNNIDPKIISHPANCQYITNLENISKNDKSILTIEELEYRIANNDFTPVSNEYRLLPKTTDHRNKISKTNKKYMTITDGLKNCRILKGSNIPEGFRRGMIRYK